MKLKTGMEVLTIRREHFRNKLDGIDKEMTDFINNKATFERVGGKILKSGLKIRLQIIPELKKFGKRISMVKKRLFRKKQRK